MTERLVIKCAYGHRAEAGEAAYAELQAEAQSSRKLVADLLALLDRMGAGTCEHVTTPGFHCERNGRTPDARYGADKSCASCDYHALRQLIEAAT